MGYTYPVATPTLSGDLVTINRFLAQPTQVARRLRDISLQRYISDAILTVPLRASGGAIMYEGTESLFTSENPRAVAAGAEYPLVSAPSGAISIVKTTKWGQDSIITDESIARQLMNPVNRVFTKMVNQNVKYIDSVALAAVVSAVTQTVAAAASWTTATAVQMFKDVALAKAAIINLNEGYDPDTVVIDPTSWVYIQAAFISGGYLPRENLGTNTLFTGQAPAIIDGMKWLITPNVPTAGSALVLDSQMLGGMADEDLGGPGYAGAGSGIEVKTMRNEETDAWRIRARRITVPVILEPNAAKKITGI